jgi:hypothetical protein
VPPIFQPEVGARAVYWAADHRRAEIYVGWPTVKAIVGNKITPRLADWYLTRYGYDSQLTDVPEDPARLGLISGNRCLAIMALTENWTTGRVGIPGSR